MRQPSEDIYNIPIRFTPSPNKYSIGSIFNQWTALHLAIDQQWGGGSSSEKGERLFQDTLAFFAQSTPQDPVYADELSDFFEDAMTERFA